MIKQKKMIEQRNLPDAAGNGSDVSENKAEPPSYAIRSTNALEVHIWLFRLVLAGVAFFTVFFCHWLFGATSSGVFEALLPAIGLLAGFGISGTRGFLK